MAKVAYISNLIPLQKVRYEAPDDGKYVRYCADHNTGNYVFHNAIVKQFAPLLCRPHEYDKSREADIYLTCDFVWLPENAAPSEHTQTWLALLKKRGKAMIPLCVGLQAGSFQTEYAMHPNTLRVLQEISEMAPIPCRGEYTAETLSQKGIKNTVMLGCPSLYTALDPLLRVEKPLTLPEDAKMALGVNPHINFRAPARSMEALFRLAMSREIPIIGQGLGELAHSIELLRQLNLFSEEAEQKLTSLYRFYFNCEDWEEELEGVEFAFGTRFHGNMMQVLRGKPALFMIMDSRMQEMCRLMRLPTMEFSALRGTIDPQKLYNLADYTEFNKRYAGLLRNYTGYFEKLGVRMGLTAPKAQ